MITLRPYRDTYLKDMVRLWNESVQAQEVVYFPVTEESLSHLLFDNPHQVKPYTFIALHEGCVVGFVVGMCQTSFLPNETPENTPGYLMSIFVDASFRRQNCGSALLKRLITAFKENGKKRIGCMGTCPINIPWRIPDTPNHDHNNAPGMDAQCAGYPFLLHHGFEDKAKEVAMYLDLKEYKVPDFLQEKQETLRAQGIETGLYDPSLHYDFDRMCTRVGSEYWRKVLQDETQSPHPRPILTATTDNHIVGFTGPVDKQESGRGWFTGICTDPEFERRGIASVLFNLLMQEFISVGAEFSTLFTGEENWAQKIYLSAGFKPVRKFSYMSKNI